MCVAIHKKAAFNCVCTTMFDLVSQAIVFHPASIGDYRISRPIWEGYYDLKCPFKLNF